MYNPLNICPTCIIMSYRRHGVNKFIKFANLKIRQNLEQCWHLAHHNEKNCNSHVVVDGGLSTFLQHIWIE